VLYAKQDIAAALVKEGKLVKTLAEADQLLNKARVSIIEEGKSPELIIKEWGLPEEYVLDLWHSGNQLDCCYPSDMKWHEASMEDRNVTV